MKTLSFASYFHGLTSPNKSVRRSLRSRRRAFRTLPGGTPVVGSEEYNKFLAAKIPMVIYFGDYIDNGPENIMSTGFWKNVRDTAIEFAKAYNADGGDATVVDLPKAGITGNSHFMFQETNNKEIADHIEKWLKERGL